VNLSSKGIIEDVPQNLFRHEHGLKNTGIYVKRKVETVPNLERARSPFALPRTRTGYRTTIRHDYACPSSSYTELVLQGTPKRIYRSRSARYAI